MRLATQIGSQLVGVLYILDEPSIGLHQRDNDRLIGTLERLRDLGNTVLVVEHDEQMMRSADWIVDMGPGAGEHGGYVVAEGPAEAIAATDGSITGAFLSRKRTIAVPPRRTDDRGVFRVLGAAEHNLKRIDVDVPIGKFVCVTGVSGSGKSTLVNEIVYKALANRLNRMRTKPGAHDAVEGIECFDKVIEIDQSPIGRTPRSNPATYTDLFTHVRELYSLTPESKVRGYKPGRFSFNVRGGRCEACKGDGQIKIEMHFLPDVYVPCETCHGRRYNKETLEVRFKGKSIADVLEMSVEEALEFFSKIPKIRRRLQTLHDVGLDYVRLGQPATTLSGGEAQRVKLAAELSKVATGRTLYILDEPTTGLHFADIEKLLEVLQRLVDSGNTVLVIEHNLDVIKQADWVVDLGPEGGEEGGELIAAGTPEEIAEVEESYTGQFLRRVLPASRGRRSLSSVCRPSAEGGCQRGVQMVDALEAGDDAKALEHLSRFAEQRHRLVSTSMRCKPLGLLEEGIRDPERLARVTERCHSRGERGLVIVAHRREPGALQGACGPRARPWDRWARLPHDRGAGRAPPRMPARPRTRSRARGRPRLPPGFRSGRRLRARRGRSASASSWRPSACASSARAQMARRAPGRWRPPPKPAYSAASSGTRSCSPR